MKQLGPEGQTNVRLAARQRLTRAFVSVSVCMMYALEMYWMDAVKEVLEEVDVKY